MTAPTSGDPLNLSTFWAPELTEMRTAIINDLIAVSRDNPDSLGAPKGARARVEANVHLWTAPAAPASTAFTGVLFDALDFTSLDASASSRAEEAILIASPLYGFVRPSDRIATYRLPPTAKLPTVGAPLPSLAPAVSKILDDAAPPLVLDCRSGTYVRLWRPTVPWISVRAIELRDGKPTVVSHFAKHHRGVLTRHLLARGEPLPTSPDGVLGAAQELIGTEYRSVTLEAGPRETHVLELTLL